MGQVTQALHAEGTPAEDTTWALGTSHPTDVKAWAIPPAHALSNSSAAWCASFATPWPDR